MQCHWQNSAVYFKVASSAAAAAMCRDHRLLPCLQRTGRLGQASELGEMLSLLHPFGLVSR